MLITTTAATASQKPQQMSPEAAIRWISAMSENGAPVALCRAAEYYHAHPEAAKMGSWRLWLQRGNELAVTDEEIEACSKIKNEIDAKEAANAQK